MKRLERYEVVDAIAEVLDGMEEETLARLYGDYADLEGTEWDDKEGCFWQRETANEAVRSAMLFELREDGMDTPLNLGCVSLPPGKSLDDLQLLFGEWQKVVAESESKREAGDGNAEVPDGFVEWLLEKHGFDDATEAEGFVFLQPM